MHVHLSPSGHGFSSLPARAGIGLRSAHFRQIRNERPDIGFLEVHPENFFGGGAHVEMLEDYATLYPLSFHGVGLSLGSAGRLDAQHVNALRALVERVRPTLVSDHVAWSASGNAHLSDLLPLPYTKESLSVVADHIAQVQDALGRRMLVENPSTYLAYAHSTMREPEFLAALCERTGCGLLVDVNNIFVQCHNVGGDPEEYFSVIAPASVGELHLAGHTERVYGEEKILIDTHDAPVCDAVWQWYERAVECWGRVPTLIEWDQSLPALEVLLEEAGKAERVMKKVGARASEQGRIYAAG